MKKISEHLGQIIVALACVALILSSIVVFEAPISEFFGNIVDKETDIAQDMMDGMPGVGDLDTKNNRLTLSGDLPADTYSLRYENTTGVMTDYADICKLEIAGNGEDAVYNGFIDENCAPVGATIIGVYNSSEEKVGEIPLGSLDSSYLSNKQYSFAAISDVHIGSSTAADDFKNALTFFENDSSIKFTTICGDLATSGSTTNLNTYKSIVDSYTSKPVYAISGNHEANFGGNGPLQMDTLKPYTGEDLYYSFTRGNDVYIMVGLRSTGTFLPGELQWLYETLEANRNKRCFVFMHYFPADGSGDAVNLDVAGEQLGDVQEKVFNSLMSHYSNVIYFHGHSHEEFKTQEINHMNNYDDKFGCHSVHISSLGYPKQVSGSSLVANYAGSEGYVVDVYENYVVLRGRDFVEGKYLPIASYVLDTIPKKVRANSYYDPTGTIISSKSNVLKSGSSWYEGSLDKTSITKISFVDYNVNAGRNADESWDASFANNNQVTVYRVGTELFIKGNTNGVVANADSSEMFSGFTNVTEISGLEKLNTSNITNLQSMFKDCKKLTSINLSNFKNINVTRLDNLFSGCSSLTNIDLTNFNLSSVQYYSNAFIGCTKLQTVALNPNASSNVSGNIYLISAFADCKALGSVDLSMLTGKNIQTTQMFKECSNLTSVKFGNNKLIACVGTFMRCTAIESIDMSGLDFSGVDSLDSLFGGCSALQNVTFSNTLDVSKVKSMRSTFKNCTNLTLDCSSWDMPALTDITDVNLNAPGVVAPVIN